MHKLFFAGALCLLATACQTPQQTAGTTSGVVAGAVVGGPVGAVVGGMAGAAVTGPPAVHSAPGTATSRTGEVSSFTTAQAGRS
jgi:uncharacterized protein YcfJ